MLKHWIGKTHAQTRDIDIVLPFEPWVNQQLRLTAIATPANRIKTY